MVTKGKPYRVTVHYANGDTLTDECHTRKRADAVAWRAATIYNGAQLGGHTRNPVTSVTLTDTRTGATLKTYEVQ